MFDIYYLKSLELSNLKISKLLKKGYCCYLKISRTVLHAICGTHTSMILFPKCITKLGYVEAIVDSWLKLEVVEFPRQIGNSPN